MGDVQRDGRRSVVEFLAEAVCQPREPSRRHAEREVASLRIAGRDFHGTPITASRPTATTAAGE